MAITNQNPHSLSRLKSTIKPYFKNLRNLVILRGIVHNDIVEFQTSIHCTPSQFSSDKEIHIAIEEYREKLAIAIKENNSLADIRSAFYSNSSASRELSFSSVVTKFTVQYKDVMVPDYLRKFKTLYRSITDHCNIENPEDLPITWLNNNNMNEYTNNLLKAGLENSTIKGHLKRFRRLTKYAQIELGSSIKATQSSIKLKEKQQFVVFLTKSEVEKFAEVNTSTPGELEVKNGFLFRCYTGIRFSEMPYIDVNNLDEGVLSFYIPKTSKSHQIPLNRKALEMLKKVERFSPISQQKENMYIKKLAKRAGIIKPVQKVKLSGSKSTVETHPKWKLCSSHTARRTWARIAYEAGVDILKISRYIGHSDIATTLKYIGHKDTDFDELKDLF